MDQMELIRRLEEGSAETQRFLGIPREVNPIPEQEPFDFWGNIVDFYGLDKISNWFASMFQREYGERPTYVNPQWGKENMRTVREILEE